MKHVTTIENKPFQSLGISQQTDIAYICFDKQIIFSSSGNKNNHDVTLLLCLIVFITCFSCHTHKNYSLMDCYKVIITNKSHSQINRTNDISSKATNYRT